MLKLNPEHHVPETKVPVVTISEADHNGALTSFKKHATAFKGSVRGSENPLATYLIAAMQDTSISGASEHIPDANNPTHSGFNKASGKPINLKTNLIS